MAVRPVSIPPELNDDGNPTDNVDTMVRWFYDNFEDPANSLPYESAEGGYQWIWGGPYDAREQLVDHFPDAIEEEIDDAVSRIEVAGVEWSPADRRVAPDPDYDDDRVVEYDGSVVRELPPGDDPHRLAIVDTTLLPRRDFGWSVHATFIPLRTNQNLSEIVQLATEGGLYGRDDYQFDSLRALVASMVGRGLEGVAVGDDPSTERGYEWLNSLEHDGDIFVDDGVICHSSPPKWVILSDLFKHGSLSGVALISQSPGHWSGVLLMYGGSLLFLRLVKNINYVQDAFFERLAKKVRGHDQTPP